MRKNKICASIAADVVDSTSLSVKEMKLLHSAKSWMIHDTYIKKCG